ncbi:hypothetical protein [Bauldia sp.]|uniref:hypothetical protein n=1 Tax=Bauldia sp. TaxID=2575872 RepID=UPI003BAAE8E3
MFGVTFQDSPLLVVTVIAVAVVLVFLLISAIVSAIWGRGRGDDALPPDEDYDDEPQLPRFDDERRNSRRLPKRFGFVALLVSFIVGAVAGGGGLVVLSNDGDLDSSMRSMVHLADTASSRALAAMGWGGTEEAAPGAPALDSGLDVEEPVGEAAASEVAARLANFAARLKGTLPREAGPEFALTSVDMEGMTLNLGYTIARPMREADRPAFDGFIMRSVRSLFCGEGSQEIRFLNDHGVAFRMTYRDALGETFTQLDVPPSYCA